MTCSRLQPHKRMLSFTIMMELFLRTRPSREIQCVRHGLRGHGSQQSVYDGIVGVIRIIQRISQCFIGPDKKNPKDLYLVSSNNVQVNTLRAIFHSEEILFWIHFRCNSFQLQKSSLLLRLKQRKCIILNNISKVVKNHVLIPMWLG